ncbi:MAG TPA: 30S ribosomal protein S9, partial [Amycolatopsis sp.]|nr:30S ribosomal protein S9 [Amycolatopsis sp.]
MTSTEETATEAVAVTETAGPSAEAVATSETPATQRQSRAAGGNAQTVGRRKEAVVRVRVVPGS